MSSLADQFLDDVGPSSSEEEDRSSSADEDLDTLATNEKSNPIPTDLSETTRSLLSNLITSPLQPLLPRIANTISLIDDCITNLHAQLLPLFHPCFPELHTLIPHPLDFSRIARLGLDQPLTEILLRPLLPSATVITVLLAASSTKGQQLSPSRKQTVIGLCDAIQQLAEWRAQLIEHLRTGAESLVPNLSVIVGPQIAATLIGFAGGIKELARMPSSNVKTLGKSQTPLFGASTQTRRPHEGVIYTCPLVMSLPKHIRSKAGDVIVGKAVLAARVDACRDASSDDSAGKQFRAALEAKFEKWMERAPAKKAVPLPIPGEEKRGRHRAGRRARKEKERMGMTDMRRMTNRIQFGGEGDVLDDDGTRISEAAAGAGIRVRAKKTDTVAVAARRKLEKERKKDERRKHDVLEGAPIPSVEDGAFELSAGSNAGGKGPGESRYFSATTPFRSPKRRKLKENGDASVG